MNKWKIISIVLIVLLLVSTSGGLYWVGEKNIQIHGLKGEITKKDDTINKLQRQVSATEIKPLINPTDKELVDFLARDKTNEKKYVESIDFATEQKENANKEGFRAGVACLLLGEKQPFHLHFINAYEIFDKSDKKVVYVEAQYDKEVTTRKNESYCEQNHWEKKPWDDKINRVYIIW